MPIYLPYEHLIEELDVREGEVLLVGSDLTRLAFECLRLGGRLDSDRMIEAFQRKLGQGGTLLFPTFNWGFCSGEDFDYRRTPSKTGAITQTALKRPDFVRTQHPIYSFAVWGRDSGPLAEMTNRSSFGDDSPFAYLRRTGARMLIIGLDYQRSFTFAHHVEEMEQVDYRYAKDFSGQYVDRDGRTERRTYSMYVRNLERGVVTRLNPLGEKLEADGAAIRQELDGTEVRLIDLGLAYEITREEIRRNGAKRLYAIEH